MGTKIACITYNDGDILEVPDGTLRQSFYSVPYFPIAYKDGNLNGLNTVNPTYPGWLPNWTQAVIDNQALISSPFAINLSWQFTPANDSVSVTCVVTATEAVTMTTPKLQLALIERTIHFATPPGSNGETDFWNVCRKMYPDAGGTALPTTWSNGQQQTFIFKQIIPTNVYVKTQIAFVAFIQDNATKDVKQTKYAAPQALNSINYIKTDENINISVYPNPIQDKSVVSFFIEEPTSVIFQIVDPLGRVVYTEQSKRESGVQNILLDSKNLSNGIYYIKLDIKGKNYTKKVVISK